MSNTLDNLIKERAPLIFKSSLTANLLRRLLMKIFNISKNKIVKFEIPTGNPLLIKFNNSKVVDYKYLNVNRAKKIFFNI